MAGDFQNADAVALSGLLRLGPSGTSPSCVAVRDVATLAVTPLAAIVRPLGTITRSDDAVIGADSLAKQSPTLSWTACAP